MAETTIRTTAAQRADSLYAAEMSKQAAHLTARGADAIHRRCWGLTTPISGDHLRALPGRISVWDVLKARDDS